MQNNNDQSLRVLGIDPGYERLGIAIVEKTPRNKEALIFSECFKTSSKLSHDRRLVMLGEEIKRVIKKFKPTDMAIEQLFFNDNQKTALLVGEARGVITYEAALGNLEIYEYTPLEIKVAVTGYGRSNKEQVSGMIEKLITIPARKILDDEFDAIAICLTHIASKRFMTR